MRALFDTNIFISYLLQGKQQRVITSIVESAIVGAFTLLLPQGVLTELREKVATKEYLRTRIQGNEADRLVARLVTVAEVLPPFTPSMPAATRDPKDDYLLAHALMAQADYLVTGDHDLLALRKVGRLNIATPADFAEMLEARQGGER